MKVVQVILVAAFLLGAGAVSAQDAKKSVKSNKTEQIVFSVNMHCDGCEQKIKKNIAYEKGVKNLTTNLEKQLVTIWYQPDKTDKTKLKKAIEKLGYTCTETTGDK